MAIKPKVARAVHANRGIAALYHRRLRTIIGEMANSAEYWITASYRSAPPILAQDATPANEMRESLKALAKRWQKRFDELAPTVAESFLKNSFRGTDSAFRQALKDAGWAVEFTMTPAIRDAFAASLAENVGLIKSIPFEYFSKIEGIVMRGYSSGRDLHAITEGIKALYPVTADRAVFIARDQANKANATITRARQIELKVTEAVWLHSHGGRVPRPTHVAMNGKRYPVDKGMWDSAVQRFIFPGEEINCRCVCRSVLPWTPAESPKAPQISGQI